MSEPDVEDTDGESDLVKFHLAIWILWALNVVAFLILLLVFITDDIDHMIPPRVFPAGNR